MSGNPVLRRLVADGTSIHRMEPLGSIFVRDRTLSHIHQCGLLVIDHILCQLELAKYFQRKLLIGHRVPSTSEYTYG